MTFSVPILLLCWRRPDTLRQVIDAIRPSAPTRMFVACDGPNIQRIDEAEKVAATRAVVSKEIDWPCQLKLFYSDINQGCRLGVSSAITWFFDHVDQGIILEDDCIPSPFFLDFCQVNLKRYENDPRIWQISGYNSLVEASASTASLSPPDYFYSKYGSIWGWASWRDRWVHFDSELSFFDDPEMLYFFLNSLEPWENPARRLRQINLIRAGYDTWDWQWLFCRILNSGLSVVPASSLISNCGFGPDATHTTQLKSQHRPTDASLQTDSSCYSKHILINKDYDRCILKRSTSQSVARKYFRRLIASFSAFLRLRIFRLSSSRL